MAGSASDESLKISIVDDRAITDAAHDQFAYDPVAERLMALLASYPTELTIGLFGPWGSGKSSLLKLVQAKLQAEASVGIVEIDAWRYGEVPLARQFVSQAAEQLALQTPVRKWVPLKNRVRSSREARAGRRAWAALYESRRSRQIRLRSDVRTLSLALVVVGALAALAVSVGLATWIEALAAERSWQESLQVTLRRWGGVLPILFGSGALFGLLTIDSDVTKPGSQEEFEDALRKELRRHRKWCKRVVFFVDELDRTGPAELLATIRTIRAFLGLANASGGTQKGVPSCSFVVAVDRQLLEASLVAEPMHHAAPQPSTTYSGLAGSLLDKLFAVQVDLPPIRPRRLARFARDAMRSEGGIWDTLGAELDDVISVLVPPHVRSPRRVKVLLNAYSVALATSRARSRGNPSEVPSPQGREVELAALVCLRTEFPLFASDVHEQPELLFALSDTVHGREVAGRYDDRVVRIATDVFDGNRAVEQALPVFEGQTSDATEDDLEHNRRDELLAYLRLLDDVSLPRRDLIFGQSLGDLYGLTPAIADDVEQGALAGLPLAQEYLDLGTDERTAVALLLADLAESEIGLIRRRCVEALAAALEKLGDLDPTQLADRLTPLAEEWWASTSDPNPVRALRLARWAGGGVDNLAVALIEDATWAAEPESLRSVLQEAAWWPPPFMDAASDAVVSAASAHPDALVQSLEELPREQRGFLWPRPAWQALASGGDEPLLRRAARSLAEAARSSAWEGVQVLLGDASTTDLALALVQEVGGPAADDELLDVMDSLITGSIAPTAWDEWAAAISAGGGTAADGSLDPVLTTVATVVSADPDKSSAAGRLLRALFERGLRATPAVASVLPASGSIVEAQRLSDLYRSWSDNVDVPIGATEGPRRDAVLSILQGRAVPADDQRWLGEEIARLAEGAPDEWRQDVLSRARSVLTAEAAVTVEVVIRVAGGDALESALLSELAAVATSASGAAAAATWLLAEAAPSPGAVHQFLVQAPSAWRRIAQPFATYLDRLSKPSATDLVIKLLLLNGDVPGLLEHLSIHSISQRRLADAVAKLLRDAFNESDRRAALRRASALRFESPGARHIVGQAAVELAKRSSAAALDVVHHLGPDELSPSTARDLHQISEDVAPSLRKRVQRAVGRWFS